MNFSKERKAEEKSGNQEAKTESGKKRWLRRLGILAAAAVIAVISVTRGKTELVIPKLPESDPTTAINAGGKPEIKTDKKPQTEKTPSSQNPPGYRKTTAIRPAEKLKTLTPLEKIRAQLPPNTQEDWDTLEKYCGDLIAKNF